MGYSESQPCVLQSSMRDGVNLFCDCYYSLDHLPRPVMLMRTAYGREIASTLVYAHPTWYLKKGFNVVIQDVRGTGNSEGIFDPLVNEANDGFDTIEWVASQEWCDGNVVMYGFSYQGMVQYLAAGAKPPHLKAIVPAMAGLDFQDDWLFRNGIFKLYGTLTWALQLDSIKAKSFGDYALFNRIYLATRNFDVNDFRLFDYQWMRNEFPNSIFHDWLSNRGNSSYWSDRSMLKTDTCNIPMLHIGGWFDAYCEGTVQSYLKLCKLTDSPQQLIIGPWSHISWHRFAGAKDYGIEAESFIDSYQVSWFNAAINNELSLTNRQARIYVLGIDKWTEVECLTANRHLTLFPGNSQCGCQGDGRLLSHQPHDTLFDVIVHDPWRPAPAKVRESGNIGVASDRRDIDYRSDNMAYTSEPFDDHLDILGALTLNLMVEANNAPYDLHVTFTYVTLSGESIPFASGCVRICDTGKIVAKLTTDHIAIRVKQGDKLRLNISCSAFPIYELNPANNRLQENCAPADFSCLSLRIYPGKLSLIDIPYGDFDK